MEKTIGNAFKYMFKDENLFTKFGVLLLINMVLYGSICLWINEFITRLKTTLMGNPTVPTAQFYICLIIALIILILFGTIGTLYMQGFLSKSTQNVIKNDGTEPLKLAEPDEGFLNFYFLGAKKNASIGAFYTLAKPANILIFIVGIVFGFLSPALNKIFCEEFKFKSYFSWKTAFDLICKNWKLYLGIIIIEIVSYLLLFSMIIILPIFEFYYPLEVIIISLYMTYLSLVFAFFNGIIGEKEITENEITTEE